jgi:hypothetical protein
MLKRHIVRSDEVFLAELTTQSGPEYVKRFNVLFEDLHHSVDVNKKFSTRRAMFSPFHAIVLAKDAWPTVEATEALPPAAVRGTLAAFTEFYRSKFSPRKLEWSLEFSRVKLSYSRALPEVRCNGIAAVVLLAFNQAPIMTTAEIAAATKLSEADVESIMTTLTNKRSGWLCIFMHGHYRVNPDAEGSIAVPVAFPTLPAGDERKGAVDSNRERQVEGATMVVMKRERSLEKGDLRQRVKDLLQFRLDDELFENRLAHLAQNLYLRLDTSGRVQFLP